MTGDAGRRFPWQRALVLWAAVCVLLVLVNFGAIGDLRFPDADDTLRLVQVRDLLAGQGWFDLHQYRIDPPHGVPMHWSRLVDLPLALVIGLLTPLLGAANAELAALVAVPLLTLGAILLAVARISSTFFDRDETTFACLSLGLAPLLMVQVMPLRIDHHGWQVACVMVALLGLLPGREARGAALSGVALGFGLTISLEVLPIAVGFGGLFALRWLTSRDNRSLPLFTAGLTVTLAVLLAVTRGADGFAIYCDVISAPYMALLGVVALGVALVARLAPGSVVVVAGSLLVVAAVGLATFLSLAPQCAGGPFVALDPLVERIWYRNVLEGMPVWRAPLLLAVPVALAGAIALAVLAYLAKHRPVEERRWWLEYLGVAAVAWCAALLTWRSQAFVGALSAVPVGWLTARLLAQLRQRENPGRKVGAGALMIAVLMPGFPASFAQASGLDRNASDVANKPSAASCELTQSAARLDRLPPATIFAPLDAGPDVLERSHHRVVATSHHRATEAMHDVILAFTSPPMQAEPLIRSHGASYVLLCADIAEVRLLAREAPRGLAAQLIAGQVPDWLEPVEIGAPETFKLWRVRD